MYKAVGGWLEANIRTMRHTLEGQLSEWYVDLKCVTGL